MRITSRLIGALVAMGFLISACSSDAVTTREEAIDTIVEASDGVVDEATAGCIVDYLVEETGKTIEEIDRSDPDDAELQAAITDAAIACI